MVGQLEGGFSSCTSQTSDWYGRFSVSWEGGGSPSTRLRDWLDPGSTGALTVDTISGAGLQVSPAGDVEHLGLPGGPFTNPTVTYTLGNPTPTPINYQVSLTSSFGLLLDGGTAPLVGFSESHVQSPCSTDQMRSIAPMLPKLEMETSVQAISPSFTSNASDIGSS